MMAVTKKISHQMQCYGSKGDFEWRQFSLTLHGEKVFGYLIIVKGTSGNAQSKKTEKPNIEKFDRFQPFGAVCMPSY